MVFVRSIVGILVRIGLAGGNLVVSSSECKFAHPFFPCCLPKRRHGKYVVFFGGGAVK